MAAVTYAGALLVIAAAGNFSTFLVGMTLAGVGFGAYMAVDLALVVDVLPDPTTAAKDLGILNIAGALPFAVAPTVAPAILILAGGSYSALYAVAALCALGAAATVMAIRSIA